MFITNNSQRRFKRKMRCEEHVGERMERLISGHLIQKVVRLPSFVSCKMQVFKNRNMPEIKNILGI